MIPQMHDEKIQGEKQLPSPVEDKHIATPLEKRSTPTPASPRRWIGVLLSIIGIVLPFAGVFMITTLVKDRAISNVDESTLALMILGMFLAVCVGAALLRSWWAILIVPVACAVAGILGLALYWPLSDEHFWDTTSTLLLMASVPTIFCAALGAGVGVTLSHWLKQRRQQR
jgi:hypothetical protein